MPPYAKAAASYFALVFAAAFLLGALRVTVVAPLTGPLAAVAIEVPIILGLSWLVAGRALQRWPLSPGNRLAMGAIAFALLMAAEISFASLIGQSPGQFIATMGTLPGALGLAGQIGFAVIPALRGQARG